MSSVILRDLQTSLLCLRHVVHVEGHTEVPSAFRLFDSLGRRWQLKIDCTACKLHPQVHNPESSRLLRTCIGLSRQGCIISHTSLTSLNGTGWCTASFCHFSSLTRKICNRHVQDHQIAKGVCLFPDERHFVVWLRGSQCANTPQRLRNLPEARSSTASLPANIPGSMRGWRL